MSGYENIFEKSVCNSTVYFKMVYMIHADEHKYPQSCTPPVRVCTKYFLK